MKITLIRFKAYIKETYKEFNMKELTLLDGESGDGKTTILEAILWCLYGNMQNIYPTGTPSTSKEQTCVLLEFPEINGIYVRRTKPPEVIEVGIPFEGKYKILVSSEAQSYIENIFGTKELFIVSSYIQQGERCPLITGSNSDKTQLLHQLTFGSSIGETENPDVYLERINTELSSLKNGIVNETAKYNALSQAYTTNRLNNEVGYIKWNSATDTPEGYENKKKDLENKVKKIDEEISKLVIKSTKYTTLKEQLSKIEIEEPSKLDPEINDKIENLNLSINAANEQKSIESERNDLLSQLKNLNEIDVSEEDISSLRSIKKKIHEQMVVCDSIGISYTQESKDKFILKCESKIGDIKDKTKQLEAYNERVDIIDQKYNKALELDRERVSKENEAYNERVSIINENYNKALELDRQRVSDENDIHRINYGKEIEVYNQAELKYSQELSRYNDWEKLNACYIKNKHDYDNYVSKINECKISLDNQKEKVQSLKSKILKDHSWYKEFYAKDDEEITVNNLEKTVQKLHNLKSQLHCPHCDGSLTFDNGILSKGLVDEGSRDIWDLHISKILEYIRDIESLKTNVIILDNIESKLSGFSDINEPETVPNIPHPTRHDLPIPIMKKSENGNIIRESYGDKPVVKSSSIVKESYGEKPVIENIELWEDYMIKCNSIVIIEHSIDKIDEILEAASMIPHIKALKARVAYLETKIIPTGLSIDDMIETKKNLEMKVAIYTKDRTMYEINIAKYNTLKEEIILLGEIKSTDIDDMKIEKTNIKADIKECESMCESYKAYTILKNSFSELEAQKSLVLRYTKYEVSVSSLKATIQELASQSMEETVDAINVITNQILKEVFVDNIQVVLKTHKELKSKSSIKLQVNLQVTYRGLIYDSPSRLSGGEQDRISLALTLAMAKVSGSPILLLDECMSSIGENLQELCLEMIEMYARDQTIIHICHRATQGQHSSVLSCCSEA